MTINGSVTAQARAFERAVRQRVKRKLKASPNLLAQVPAGRRDHRLLLFALLFGFAVIAWGQRQQIAQWNFGPLIRAAPFALTLLTTGIAFLFSALWKERHLQSSARFAALPISEREHFLLLFREWLRGSWRLPGFLLAVYLVLAYFLGFGWFGWIAVIGLAGLQWLGGPALAALLARLPFPLATPLVGLGMIILGLAWLLIVLRTGRGAAMTSVLEPLSVVFPAGAIHQALRVALIDKEPGGWLYLAPMPLWLGFLAFAGHRLWRDLSPDRTVCLTVTEESDAVCQADDSSAAIVEPAPSRAAIQERLAPSSLRRAPRWSRPGWIERVVEWSLTPRQREIAGALTQGEPAWTRNWAIAMGLTVVAFALALVPMPESLSLLPLFAFILAFVSGGVSMSYFPGMELSGFSKLQVPPFCFAPIATEEFGAVVGKVVAVRFVGLLPTAMFFGAAFGLEKLPAMEVAVIACKAGYLLLALAPFFVSMNIDVSSMSSKQCPAWLAAPLGLCFFVAMGSGFLLLGANSLPSAAVGAVVCPASSLLFMRCHLHAYRRWMDMSRLEGSALGAGY